MAEKEKLTAELASSAMVSSEAKKEVMDSVSHVLEDEFQCAICNELFINVSINYVDKDMLRQGTVSLIELVPWSMV